MQKIGGYYKGYKYPTDKPHWTTLLKQIIKKTGFVGTWKQAIKQLWNVERKKKSL